MGYPGPGSHVGEHSRTRAANRLEATVQSMMAGANVAREMEGDKAVISVLQFNFAKR